MGIQGLLPTLKSIMNPRHIRDYAGKRVAIDTYSWLHKAAFSCSKELCLGLPNDKYIDYCMHRVNMLRHFGLQPVLVFDGGGLPMKSDQEMKRARSRKENLERALEHERLGNFTAAMQCYQRAVDITPAIAFRLIKVLRQENVEYVVAPYEADAQMAFLARNGHVDLVITEDSDLIAYGCPQIFFKMDKYGQGVGFQFSDITANKDIDFNNFSRQMILEMCIMSGCDYLPSLPGMGVKKAHGLMKRFKTYIKVMKHLKFSGVLIDEQYEQGFRRAILTFQHHRVYDPAKRAMVHLTDVPGELVNDLHFLGPCVSPTVAIAVARGEVDPTTYDLFEEVSSSGTPIAVTKEKVHVGSLNVPVDVSPQKNMLITNFFQGADVASKKQFIPPRSASNNTPDNASFRFCATQEEMASQVTSSPTSLSQQSYSSPFSKFSFTSQQSPVFSTPPSQVSPFVSEELDLDADLQRLNDLSSDYSPPDYLLRTRSFSEVKPKLQIPSPFTVDSLIRSRSVEVKSRKTFVSPLLHDTASQNASKTKVPVEATSTAVTVKRSAYFSRPVSLQSPPTSPGTIQIQRNVELLAKFEDSQRSTSTCTSEGGEIADHREFVNDVVDCPDLDQKQEILKDITNIERSDAVAAGKRKHLPHFQSDLLGERPMKSRSISSVSHVGQYASLAQRSMDDFVSTIAPFRLSQTGSRASGLRAPLKQGSRASGLRAPPKSARKASTSRID
ncbi:exonuclease 1 isoform X3 [Physcomitrium patens]|uniref:Exonuclease 1 n=1 Tax=Physcomitrium patens TaxID=3218 RepID=A0A7I4CSY9_PHYPA|nr:exonuclease 1-like isoform X3 [Physcomitrium patens]|eukprot:XP_024363156.1 exonuclease 1-like isoform X3 [Physcomitrella patens]